jgi:putative transposase
LWLSLSQLAIEIDLNQPAPLVIRVLERMVGWRSYPNKLRMDHGLEFISAA